mmetsp:Transcript_19209/g.40053  ORF Transcript_19209/g.40053 Transcript_19209/m.40053 type:complete len:90 (-) Transcript_19209:47-316(-)
MSFIEPSLCWESLRSLQRDQIKDITEEVMQIEDNLSRADKLIKTFDRRMGIDKFKQCFTCVIQWISMCVWGDWGDFVLVMYLGEWLCAY